MGCSMEVIPKISIGSYKIGMHKLELENILGAPHDTFRRCDDSDNLTLNYNSLFFEIDNDGLVLQILAFPPSKVTLDDIELLDRPTSDVIKDLNKHGHSIEPNDVGVYLPKLSINLVAVDDIIDCVELYAE